MKAFVKDPQATLDYTLNWAPWLDGDTITVSNWVVESPVASESESISPAFDATTIFVSGGTANEDYILTNTITTFSGRIDERSIRIKVRNR